MKPRPPIALCYDAVVELDLADRDLAAHVAGWLVDLWRCGAAGVC